MIAFHTLAACLLSAAAAVHAVPADARSTPATGTAQALRATWDRGLHLDSPGDAVQMVVGGRLQLDFGGYADNREVAETFGPFDHFAVRRARVFFSLTLHEDLFFRVQGDAGYASGLKDLYVEYRGLPVRLRFGHFKEPMGLEGSTSSKYTTFLERGLTNAVIAPRNVGVMASANHVTGRIAWAAAVFRESPGNFDFGSPKEWAVTLRASSAPLYRDGGRRLVHFGVDYRYQGVDGSTRIRQRPELILAPNLIDTGNIIADSRFVWVFENAVVAGPWSLQSELVSGHVQSVPSDDPHFWAFYVYGSYFLTGESRPYRLQTGLFDRLVPAHPVADGTGGRGAWEIAARFSRADLDDHDVRGGQLADITAGLNWYPTATTRWLFNVIHVGRQDYPAFWELATRLQVAF
jgi:phosphate-selective porin OprO/OprP